MGVWADRRPRPAVAKPDGLGDLNPAEQRDDDAVRMPLEEARDQRGRHGRQPLPDAPAKVGNQFRVVRPHAKADRRPVKAKIEEKGASLPRANRIPIRPEFDERACGLRGQPRAVDGDYDLVWQPAFGSEGEDVHPWPEIQAQRAES